MHKAIALVLIIFSTLSFASDWMWNTLISRYQFEKEKQAYCYRNKVGRIVGENIDKQVRPASVTKLYVSLWALDELGKDFRFETKFHVFEDRIHIEGQLDPFFTTENLYYIISSLNDLGYEEIKTLSFDKKFLFNWSDSPSEITELLKGYLNTDLWNEAHKLEFENLIYQNDQLGLNLPLRDQLNFSVEEVKFESIPSNNPILTGTFKSSPIHRHLKQMNIYSTNFIAMKIFDYLGGQKAFAKYMKKIFQVGTRTISFQNGAGFEPNVTTCRLTIQTIERLKHFINVQNLKLQDIISVPGEDLGTLRNRYQTILSKTLVAKTGTLRHTSALSGFLNTDLGEIPFGIFNHTYKTKEARNFQDLFVVHLFTLVGDPQSYMYHRSDYIPLIESKLEFEN